MTTTGRGRRECKGDSFGTASAAPAAVAFRLLYGEAWPLQEVEELLGRPAVHLAREAHAWLPALGHLSALGLHGVAPSHVEALLAAVAR